MGFPLLFMHSMFHAATVKSSNSRVSYSSKHIVKCAYIQR